MTVKRYLKECDIKVVKRKIFQSHNRDCNGKFCFSTRKISDFSPTGKQSSFKSSVNGKSNYLNEYEKKSQNHVKQNTDKKSDHDILSDLFKDL